MSPAQSPSIRPLFCAVLLSLFTMLACSSADDTGVMRPHGGETNGAASSTNATQPTDPGDTSSTSNTDQDPSTSNDQKPADGGTDAPSIDPNPFAGAPAYVAKLGKSARITAHPFTNDNPAGKACFSCHGGTAPALAFGGTIYTSAAGTTAAGKVEIRVKDKDGKALSAWSDADGNFYFLLNPNGELNLPGHAGARDAKGTKVMSSTIADGNCNGCHNATKAGRLVAP